MEKLMYLVWLDPPATAEVADRPRPRRRRPPVARSVGLTSTCGTPRATSRPRFRLRRARRRCTRSSPTLDRRRRLPGALREGPRGIAERLAGYEVVESLPRLRRTEWSAAREWPDGQRSPGVLTVALLQQHPAQTFDDWMTLWHTRISPITRRSRPAAATSATPSSGRSPTGPHRSGASWRRRGPPGARDGPHAVLLRRRRPRAHERPRLADDRRDQRVRRPEHPGECHHRANGS